METIWKVKEATYGNPELAMLLDDGWEPFAVTCLGNPDYALIWLRKKVREADNA